MLEMHRQKTNRRTLTSPSMCVNMAWFDTGGGGEHNPHMVAPANAGRSLADAGVPLVDTGSRVLHTGWLGAIEPGCILPEGRGAKNKLLTTNYIPPGQLLMLPSPIAPSLPCERTKSSGNMPNYCGKQWQGGRLGYCDAS